MKNLDVDRLLSSLFDTDPKLDIKAEFDKILEANSISKTRALKLLNIDKDVFDEIINGTAKQPNLINIVKIAEFLGIDINEFIKIVLSNQSPENIASLENAKRATFIMKNFDLKALTKLGFFSKGDSVDEMAQRILDYFGYASVREFEEELEEPLYSRTKRPFSDKMKDFWIKSGYQIFSDINNPHEYNREALKELIPKIKPYTQDREHGLLIVCRALYKVGVTVIFQDYLTTTHVKGATFSVNEKPCIILTNYGKKYPTLWFTLMHELYHVLFDFTTIQATKFHLSGDDDLFLMEGKANLFARNYFLPEEKYNYIKTFINSPYMVNRFAMENEIDVSIIYSFYEWYQSQFENKNYYGTFNAFYPEYRELLEDVNKITLRERNTKEISRKQKLKLETT